MAFVWRPLTSKQIGPGLRPFAAAAAVVLLAAALRLWRLDLAEFKADEANALRLAEDLVQLGRFPLVGLSSSLGARNPPLFIYFLAPWVAIGRDPLLATAAVALANVAAVAGTLWLGWRVFGPLAGLVGALLLAANPWAVFYSRKIWAQDLLPACAVLFFLALERAVLERRPRWALAALPILAIGVQLHFSFALLAPLLLAPLATLIGARRWRHLAAGLAAALLTTTPYLLHNLQHDWTELRTLAERLGQPPVLDVEGPGFVLGLATGWATEVVAGVPLERVVPLEPVRAISALAALLLILALWIALGRLAAALRAGHGRTAMALGGLLLWLLLPPLLTVRHGTALYPHYFLPVSPAPFLLIGAALQWLARPPARWARLATVVTLGAVALVTTAQIGLVARLVDHLAVAAEPGYGLPLAQSQRLASQVAAFGRDAGAEHLSLEVGGDDASVIGYLARPSFRTVAAQDWGAIGLGHRPGPPPGPSDPSGRDDVAWRVEPRSIDYAPGLALRALAFRASGTPGEPVTLALAWTLAGPPGSHADLAWEVTLVDWEGRWIARQRGARLPLDERAPGERAVSWFSFRTAPDLRPGTYRLAVRLVDRASGQAVPYTAPAGQAGDEWSAEPIALRRRFAAPLPPDLQARPATLGPAIRLLGFRWLAPPAPLAPGGQLAFELFWQALADPPGNATVFVQLVGAQTNPRTGNRLWAQIDRLPRAGQAPTAGWAAGSVVQDPYQLALPPDLPPGRYELQVGLYDPPTGQRLPVELPSGPDPAARVLLATLETEP